METSSAYLEICATSDRMVGANHYGVKGFFGFEVVVQCLLTASILDFMGLVHMKIGSPPVAYLQPLEENPPDAFPYSLLPSF